jgi:hypothetical protein
MTVMHRPSNAARTVQCPGSVQLCAKYPETEQSEHAALGTLAHEVASGKVPAPDADMQLAVEMYLNDINTVAHETGQHATFEEFVSCPTIHLSNGGTPDAWLYDPVSDVLYVWDFKYGHGFVDHFENWQLINYAAGLLAKLAKNPNRKVVLTIIQPRCFDKRGPIRRWSITERSLQPYFDRLIAAYKAAHYSDAECVTGPECDYCAARHACVALQRSAYRGVELSTASLSIELDGTSLGIELSILQKAQDRLTARIDGLIEQGKQMARRGDRVAGYHLEQGFGREKWSDGSIAQMMFGDVVIKPQELITPKQAIAKGCDAEMVASLTIIPPGEVKLKPDGTQLAGVFNNG